MFPPIPLPDMMHFLDQPHHVAGSTYNRAILPKRSDELKQSITTNYVEGWGLHFKEKVWETPLHIIIKACGIIGVVAYVGCGLALHPKRQTSQCSDGAFDPAFVTSSCCVDEGVG
jgi:hypothetical protein